MGVSEWVRLTPYVFVAAVVFEFMHIADELAGNWAPFGPMNTPMVATVSMGIFTLAGLSALWWIAKNRPWGYLLAGFFGLFFLIAEIWHYVDPANMSIIRWVIVLLAQLAALLVVLLVVAKEARI